MNTIDEIMDKLWIAGVNLVNANSISDDLAGEQADLVETFLKNIGLFDPMTNEDASQILSRGQALFLAAMAKYHSDSIVFLPSQLRQKRIEKIGQDIGVSTETVRQALQLGPAGIDRHIAALQD